MSSQKFSQTSFSVLIQKCKLWVGLCHQLWTSYPLLRRSMIPFQKVAILFITIGQMMSRIKFVDKSYSHFDCLSFHLILYQNIKKGKWSRYQQIVSNPDQKWQQSEILINIDKNREWWDCWRSSRREGLPPDTEVFKYHLFQHHHRHE